MACSAMAFFIIRFKGRGERPAGRAHDKKSPPLREGLFIYCMTEKTNRAISENPVDETDGKPRYIGHKSKNEQIDQQKRHYALCGLIQ